MEIGALGDVVFEVSSKAIETLNKFTWKVSAKFAEHKIHAGDTLLEFVGREEEKIGFDIELSRELGVEPMAEIEKLLTYCRNGKALNLVIGTHAYGTYKWVIKDVAVKVKRTDKYGDISNASVSVDLLSYTRR